MKIQTVRILTPALALMLWAGHAQAQDAGAAAPPVETAPGASAGRDALQRAADEIKNAQAITYQFELKAEGILAAAYPTSRGQVWAMRDDKATNSGGWLVRIMGESEGKDGVKQAFDMAWRTGNEVEWVDHEAKKVMTAQGRQPTGGKGIMIAQKARLSELLATTPLAAELAATNFEDLPSDTVSGEACTIVKVPGKRGNTKFEWAIAQSDAMPRRVTQVSEGSFSSTITLTTSDWIVETGTPQRVSAADLRVARPEGYTDGAGAAAPVPQNIQPMRPPVAAPETKPAETQSAETKPEATPAPSTDEPKGEAPPKAEADPLAGSRLASDFELATPQGEKVALKDLRGKVVVLHVFGSWCLPCQPWHKALVDAVEEGAGTSVGDVKVLAIAVRERDPQNAVQEFARAGVADAVTLLLKGDPMAREYGVKLYPTTYVIDREGRIRAELRGQTSTEAADSLRETIRTLVGETSTSTAKAG